MQMTRESEYITIKDVMAILKISRHTAYRKIIAWGVPVFRDGALVRVDAERFFIEVKKRERNGISP